MKKISHIYIEEFLTDVLSKEKIDSSIVDDVVQGLVQTSLRGVDTHGIRLFPHYLSVLKGGRINGNPNFKFERTGASTAILDADHTFGHAACYRGARHAIDIARETGICLVSIKNSSHCGAMACYGLEIAKKDMIGLAFTNATSKLRSPNSIKPFFGINPICLTAPMDCEEPFCFDSAPSHITSNKLKMHKESGELLPIGVAANEDGIPTQDPNKAFQLLPIGDYKGFGWAMMVEILCGVLSGMPTGNEVSGMYGTPLDQKRYLSQCIGAIDISKFQNVDNFKYQLTDLAIRTRNNPKLEKDMPSMIPGDPEKIFYEDRIVNGIPISEFLRLQFKTIADSYNISLFN
jgi:ureidoglycolate dehydrogenase (NAD+)